MSDVSDNETPEEWEAEVDTAEQAITQAQASFLDVLELSREVQVSLSPDREERATCIRKLRYRLDDLLEEQQQKPAA